MCLLVYRSQEILLHIACCLSKRKMFAIKYRNIFVAETMFPSLPHVFSTRNIDFPIKHAPNCKSATKYRSTQCSSQKCFQVCPGKHGETLAGNNVSPTTFPSLRRTLLALQEELFNTENLLLRLP